ncbi:MAG: hypothetical protein Q8M26_01540 [Pseudolabrys sp.]|nr:hypothetical protein [Pseudolabrys sp.]
MAIEMEPSEPDLRNIRKHLHQGASARGVLGWGGLALLALSALVLTSQTQSGSERLQQALGSIASEPVAVAVKTPEPVRPVAASAPEKDAETRRLEAQLRALEADRDRLTARIATLERNLEDMTGSIRAQAERPAPVAPAAAAPMPVPSAPLTIPETRAPETRAPQASAPDTAPPSVAQPAVPAPAPATPPQAAAPIVEHVPMPPVRVAVARPAPEPPPARAEFGIDLGGAPNADALRARWTAIKANFGPLLGGLHPVAVRDRRAGSTELRLVVGPLPTAAAARDLCARFADAQAACRTGRYDGESFVPR